MRKADPSQSYDERMKRFWHYWNMKTATENMIETAPGELRIIVDVLGDYHNIASESVEGMDGYQKAAWTYHLRRIKQIQKKIEQFIGYDRDRQLEICQRKRPARESDVGEDAMVLMLRKGNAAAKAKKAEERK